MFDNVKLMVAERDQLALAIKAGYVAQSEQKTVDALTKKINALLR